jgi:hypothetical protein
MGGALMQLVAVSSSDVYLSGNPEMSFFDPKYKRHTHFAMESIEQWFHGKVQLGKKLTCTVSRNGDGIGTTYIVVDLPEVRGRGVQWVEDVGHALIKTATVEIGGTVYDNNTGEWMRLWSDLTKDDAQKKNLRRLISSKSSRSDHLPAERIYIPLQLFFCGSPAMCIKLISLRFHEVRINIDTHAVADLLEGEVHSIGPHAMTMFIDYYFWDTDERRKVAQRMNEAVIETVEHKTYPRGQTALPLEFVHRSKEIVFMCRGPDGTHKTADGGNPVRSAVITMGGKERFARRSGQYFDTVQPFQHHSNVPDTGINVYSFSIRPEDYQPSGHCSFGKETVLDLELEPGDWEVTVYSRGYRAMAMGFGMARFLDSDSESGKDSTSPSL